MLEASSVDELLLFHNYVQKFIDEKVDPRDAVQVWSEFLKNPKIGLSIAWSFKEPNEHVLEKVFSLIFKEGRICNVIGAKGSGKTSLALFLAERARERGFNVVWYGYHKALSKYYPWIKQTFNFEQIEKSVVLIDEAYLYHGVFLTGTRELKERMMLLPTIRHKGNALLFFYQDLGLVEVNLRTRLVDYMIFKPYPNMEIQESATFLKIAKMLMPQNPNENLLYDIQDGRLYYFTNPLPSVWNDELSKPFAKVSKKEAIRIRDMLEEADWSTRDIKNYLLSIGWKYEDL